MPRQVLPDFFDWEIERLVKYSNDLNTSSDGRDIRIKKRVDSIIYKYPEGEDKNHYKLSEDSKEKLRGFLEGKKHLSGTSTYGMTFIGIGENQDLYIRVVNRTGENFMFHIDKNMTVEILDVAKSPPHVGLPLLDPHFSVNSILLSFEDQVDVVSRRREKEGPKK